MTWYGPDPSRPEFGARSFRLGPHVHGHSAYLTPGSEALTNLGRIAGGRPREVEP